MMYRRSQETCFEGAIGKETGREKKCRKGTFQVSFTHDEFKYISVCLCQNELSITPHFPIKKLKKSPLCVKRQKNSHDFFIQKTTYHLVLLWWNI